MAISYTETLEVGSKAYVWNGDICYSVKIIAMDTRYIHTDKWGRFGRKSGKGVDQPHMHLANGAGEK